MEQRNVWSRTLGETHVLPILDTVLLLQQPYYFWKQSSFPLIIGSDTVISVQLMQLKESFDQSDYFRDTLLSSRLFKLTEESKEQQRQKYL